MSTRSLTAAFIATLAGTAIFAVLLVAGVTLYQRLFAGSAPVLFVMSLVAGTIGAYTGWLLGLIVYSALRGADREELGTR